MKITVIKALNGDLQDFDISRIERTIEKCAEKLDIQDMSFIEEVSSKIVNELEAVAEKLNKEEFVTIDMIEEVIEKELMKSNHFKVMKEYILLRNTKQQKRERKQKRTDKKLEENSLKVTKTNGEKEIFDMEKARKTYKLVSYGLARKCPFEVIEESLKKYVIDNMKTSDITKMLIKSAIDLISVENTEWQFIAGRLAVVDLYKEASHNRDMDIKKIYDAKEYLKLFKTYIKKGLYYKDFFDYYTEEDILEAGKYLKKKTDFTYNYTTVLMYRKRYLLNPNGVTMELPQEMYMSAALFLAIPEKKEDRLAFAKKIYDYCSTAKISLPTPTLLNARTNFHQLSSCFKFNVDDDLRGIYHAVENMAQVSKYGGGVGVYLGNVRSKGATIRGVHGAGGGVTPWIKVINDTAIAVNQLGARAGAISTTIDIFHRDIYHFLDLQTETGDIRGKSFDVFPAVSIPDLFMERMQKGEKWTLFDPKEVEDKTGKRLQDHFGEEFETFYIECENNNKLKLKKETDAKELFKTYLKSVVETGMPYAFFRDTVNRANANKHCGNIYSTQLCTEITQNTSPSKFVGEEVDEDGNVAIKYQPGESVVCNLASINVAKVNTDEEINTVIPVAMRLLDNVITLNFYPVKETELTAKKYRPVGLGFLGLAEYLAVNKLQYDSEEARDATDKLFEKYAYRALHTSHELAVERGHYPLFEGSEYSKGILFGRDEEWYKKESTLKKEWGELIPKIKEDGLRFGYTFSPAPNTSTAGVIGTTAGVLPIYKKYFVETNSVAPSVNVAPGLNEDNFWYYKEYVNIDMPSVIDMVSVIYKWIDQAISFEWIINPQRTSPKELFDYYVKAHKQGIKTVYYVRSMSLEVDKCESCAG